MVRMKTTLQKLPNESYMNLFGRKKLSTEQKMRLSIDATAEFAPQSAIDLLQRKVNGAHSRIATRKEEIQDLQIILRSGLVEKKGKIVKMTPTERLSYQQKKLLTESKLIRAKEDMVLYRKNHAEAISRNDAPMKENIKTVREMSYISMKQQFISLKGSVSENVTKDFFGMLKSYNEAKLEFLAAKPKLAMQVRLYVFAHFKKM
jgi:hypothetical protein